MAKKRINIFAGVNLGNPGLDVNGLRSVAKKDPKAFAEKIDRIIFEKGRRFKDIKDLRGLFGALSGVKVPVTIEMPGGYKREVISDSFALLVGNLTIAELTEDPDEQAFIGDQLVTELDDPHDITIVAGVDTHDVDVERVSETENFPEIGASDESYVIHSRKNGRRISISGDMIRKNDVAGAMDKINKLRKVGRVHVEKLTLKRVIDLSGSGASPAAPYVLEREGTKASLYTTTANNPSTKCPSGTRLENTALVDYTDLDAARERMNTYLDDLGERIAIPMSQTVLLVPDALVGVASRILNSEYIPGVENELNSWGPRGMWRPTLVSSARLDDWSTSAWYLGDFRGQFRRKWSQRFTYVTLGDTTESYLQKDIAFQARLSWNCEVGAVAHNRIVQALSGTTPPS
jgi:hypothetical protein